MINIYESVKYVLKPHPCLTPICVMTFGTLLSSCLTQNLTALYILICIEPLSHSLSLCSSETLKLPYWIRSFFEIWSQTVQTFLSIKYFSIVVVIIKTLFLRLALCVLQRHWKCYEFLFYLQEVNLQQLVTRTVAKWISTIPSLKKGSYRNKINLECNLQCFVFTASCMF